MKQPASEIALITGIRYFARNSFSIPAPIVCAYFSHYKKVHWGGSYLSQVLQENPCVIIRHGITFHVILHESVTPIDPGAQYALSFRATIDNVVKPYVLIRKI